MSHYRKHDNKKMTIIIITIVIIIIIIAIIIIAIIIITIIISGWSSYWDCHFIENNLRGMVKYGTIW